ncbi:hypothetical protein BMS3Abin05_02483 [bacterium BMS3Abin05]|nr:hypothetical protein BMS3Abin05_02483 [bacterium BMS3Abin05]GBE27478.1 hypothetical protein BMS3Bbin03_01403 [bacterium BMS3Bbin03]HDZ11810.1 peptidase S41 [Bacteroidota bacterium]
MRRVAFSVMTFLLLLPFLAISGTEKPIQFGRYPAPSPDGKTVAFSYRGDIWTVPVSGGRATRLTVHEAYEKTPLWSPDGRRIAFASNRNGNFDIFVMPAEGGVSRQVTYFSNNDNLTGWTPDGTALIFSSRRNFYYHRLPVEYRISLKGGTPMPLMEDYADQGKISPDGRWLAFVRGRDNWWRKHYRGSGNYDIWLYNFKTGAYRRLTDFDGDDKNPMWTPDSKTLYFNSEKDGTFNLWKMALDGSGKTEITHFKDDGVRFPQIARNGSVIAFEQRGNIFIYNLINPAENVLKIYAPSGLKTNPIVRRKFTKRATEILSSPNRKEIAFVVRGEIFVVKAKGGRAKAVTNNPARDFDINWSPSGDTLVFVSDRKGNQDIYLAFSADTAQKKLSKTLRIKLKRLTTAKEQDYRPKFSPDGKKIAYVHGNGDLYVMDANGRHAKRILKGWDAPHFNWSPDSKWLAFSRSDNEFNYDVFIMPADGSQPPVNISQHPDNDIDPVWSQDGRKLAFVSKRVANTYDVWFVFLQKKDNDKTKEDWAEEEEAAKSEKKKEKGTPVVKIDFKNIYRRLRRVTFLPGNEMNVVISPDNQTFVFSTNSAGKKDLWSVKWDGSKLNQLTKSGVNPSQIQFSKDGKIIYFLAGGGTFKRISPSGTNLKSIPFRATVTIDHKAERVEKFNEAWAAMEYRFYNPDHNGVNWNQMIQKYRPLAESVTSIEDFNDVIRLMLGELNASHLGIYPPAPENPTRSGMLGLFYEPNPSGKGLKIKLVIPNGPCDKKEVHLKKGDIVLSVDGIPIEKHVNLYRLLNNKIGEKVILSVKPVSGSVREAVVEPISYGRFMNLEYNRWVEEKRQRVHKLSRNRLGYIHVRGMSEPSLERFEMLLYAEGHGKDGLIIDVRDNGGGYTADYMLAMLEIKNHAYTIPRDGGKGYPQGRRPLYAWTKPFVVMINQYSYSNAEIFPHAVKTLKLGKLVGAPTNGSVISTGGMYLIDGSLFRIPFRGWYTLPNGVNMELHGAKPDVLVWDKPGDTDKQIDRQLETAVKVLSKEVKTRRRK